MPPQVLSMTVFHATNVKIGQITTNLTRITAISGIIRKII